MSPRKIFFFTWLCAVVPAVAQNVQWASTVVESSLPVLEGFYSVSQVLGKPNVLPATYHAPCAWVIAAREQDGAFYKVPSSQSLTVSFDTPMQTQQVAIAESYNPGTIARVSLIDSADNREVVYEELPRRIPVMGRMLNIFFPLTKYSVKAVAVDFVCDMVPGLNEIDAIGISDGKDTIKATINFAKDLPFVGEPEVLGGGINTEYTEYVPIVSPDDKILFFSRNNDPANVGGQTALGNADIWFATRNPDRTWGHPLNAGRPLNNSAANVIFSVSNDGTMLMVKGHYGEDGEWVGKGFSLTSILPSGWSNPEPMNIENFYNKNETSEAFLCNDDCTLLLSVERDDTYGDRDLYVSFCRTNGSWTEPQNLGPLVNTVGSESCPFMMADGKTLYFSSDGISGYGGKDIFVTHRLRDTSWTYWSDPENLGPMINTPGFDGYFSISPTGAHAYFSREVGENGNNDLFRIELEEKHRRAVTSSATSSLPTNVVEALAKSDNKSIASAARPSNFGVGSDLTAKPAIPPRPKFVANPVVTAPNTDRIIKEATLAGVIKAAPVQTVQAPASSILAAQLLARQQAALADNAIVQRPKMDISQLTKSGAPISSGESIRLDNIVFAFGKADLRPESFPELDSVVMFMKAHPEIGITVNGYTDDVGDDASSLTLSLNRAKSVGKYLTQKGIADTKIKAFGLGKAHPIASNKFEAGRKQNRRVEFVIFK